MRALIADDEPHLAAHLRARLQALWPDLDILEPAANGNEALRRLLGEQPEIAFLDIRMPGLSGLEVAGRLNYPCHVVFVTAYEHHAIEAFEQAAVDYLLKPVNDERLRQTVARLQAKTPLIYNAMLTQLAAMLTRPSATAPLRWIKAQCGDQIRLVAVEEVIYFQAADKYTLVMTRDEELLIRTPIKELIELLDPQLFWQIHRSTLVNARQIAAAQQTPLGRIRLQLRDRPESLDVSRSHAHLFKQM